MCFCSESFGTLAQWYSAAGIHWNMFLAMICSFVFVLIDEDVPLGFIGERCALIYLWSSWLRLCGCSSYNFGAFDKLRQHTSIARTMIRVAIIHIVLSCEPILPPSRPLRNDCCTILYLFLFGSHGNADLSSKPKCWMMILLFIENFELVMKWREFKPPNWCKLLRKLYLFYHFQLECWLFPYYFALHFLCCRCDQSQPTINNVWSKFQTFIVFFLLLLSSFYSKFRIL